MATEKKQSTGYEVWKKMVDEQLAKLETAGEEMERYGRQAAEQATAAIDEMSRLLKDQLEHTFQLARQWRKIGTDAAHRAAETVGSFMQAR
ncbi:MAG: hypothetical protein D6806_17250 [Deltaproteobacteria bacterium]|nr:MAG: hypothetical protein D6806_17250 [Deltaproteobacteria bacterium]